MHAMLATASAPPVSGVAPAERETKQNFQTERMFKLYHRVPF
jgi:hypothetical protein